MNNSHGYSNLSPAFRPVDLDGEEFATPPFRALKPRPSGRGGACSGLKPQGASHQTCRLTARVSERKAGVSNRIGIRMNLKVLFNETRLRKILLGVAVVACSGTPSLAFAKKHRADPAVIEPAAVSRTAVLEHPEDYGSYSYTLEELGALTPIELRGVDGQRDFRLSVRSDEVITSAKLRLNYVWSPALIPELSHLKVRLNDEVMSSLPLSHESNNSRLSEVSLDPSLFVDFNKLTLNLIAHYTRDCEDSMHSTLWGNVSNQSKLDITVRHLKLPNDLGLLPRPFFDKLDNSKLLLPIVFPSQPNNDTLHSAGVVASWFGALANYRDAEFPVMLNTLPSGNGIVMVAGSTAPAGLDLPAITGPSLAMVSNPLNANAKLLVIMGRDANELELSVQALTLGKSNLTGAYVSIMQMQDIPARKPYDAPNWIPTDRTVRLAELAGQGDLQVEGVAPDLIKVNFNVPPDIFSWRSAGVPLDLHYRYTPRSTPDRSVLNVSINRLFVQALPLANFPSNLEKKIKLPLLEDGKAVGNQRVLIPHINVIGQNQMQFHYFFDYVKQGFCKDVFMNSERGVIDGASTLDFSSFPHYTAMPNLVFFANDGFPFTRMADLSETAVVMPDNVSRSEMETYLTLMGRMGKITGYPALRHSIASAASVEANSDKDLILIGTAGNQPLLERWADKMHPILDKGTHTLRLPGPFERLLSRWQDRDLDDAMHRAGDLISKGDGGLGALVAFESPMKHGRSVVALTGDNPKQIADLVTSMTNPESTQFFKGDLVLQSGKRIEGFQVGSTYYVGSLPLWTSLLWMLSKQPLVLILLVAVAALLVAMAVFRYLRKLAEKRLA